MEEAVSAVVATEVDMEEGTVPLEEAAIVVASEEEDELEATRHIEGNDNPTKSAKYTRIPLESLLASAEAELGRNTFGFSLMENKK